MRTLLKWTGGFIVILILALAALWFFVFRPPPPGVPGTPVMTASGPVRGLERDGIAVYRGIPYAAPPIGDLRWRAPQPVTSWATPREVFAFSKACPQLGGPVPGAPQEATSEDCLYLNIWAPAARNSAPRAVMVWLHGGSNTNGSASFAPYGGRQLASKGVVVVSMNYRLGALGFLAHPALTRESGHGASGNYGMMDIIAGLKWVQANIRAFGGDPANVTVFGHSAGAWNMSHLQVSPLARGLYHRVIAMSGGNFGPSDTPQGVARLRAAEADGLRFAGHLGARSLPEMRAIPVDRILEIQRDKWGTAPNGGNTRGIVDGYVIPDDPYSRYAAREANSVDLLTGYTSKEGVSWAAHPVTAIKFGTRLEQDFKPMARDFLAIYPASDGEATRSNQRLEGERAFKWQVATWARLHQATGRGRVWFYRFSHTPGLGPFRAMGAGHGAELGYVFDFPKRSMRYGTQWPWNARRDIALIDTVQDYWVNFARTGDPNGRGLPTWPTFDDQKAALELDREVKVIRWPDAPEHQLMDEYMASLRGPLDR